MAKNRRVVVSTAQQNAPEAKAENSTLFSRSMGIRVVIAMAAASIIYATYWTHDSIEVSQGAARYLVTALLITSAIAAASFGAVRRVDVIVDALAWSLAGWMTLSLVFNAHHANVRLGINELGWWLATAALISISRRVAAFPMPAFLLLRLIIGVSLGIAIYGWHQWFIGFPEMIAQYKANPEAMLRQMGIVADENSATRIVFENRLYDGGPTGTFALANSMAAMLVGGMVAMIGLLVVEWSRLNAMRRSVWIVAIAIVGGMVLASRSRSAMVAIAAVILWLLITQLRNQKWLVIAIVRRRRVWIAATAFASLGIAGLVYAMRNSEWVQQAPASLAIRFRYWMACGKMFLESPWFGVGPGQFKSSYEAYRAETSMEQIADPHQFLLQTLTAGGLPSLLILLALLALMLVIYRQRSRVIGEDRKPFTPTSAPDSEANGVASGAVMFGILFAIIGVWVIGSAIGQLPTVEPALLGTIIAIIFSAVVWYHGDAEVSGEQWNAAKKIAGYGAFAIGVDQLASGGMTVPGVSVIAWMLLGIAVPVEFQAGLSPHRGSENLSASDGWRRYLLIAASVALIATWYFVGVSPIERSKHEQNQFAAAWANGRVDVATQSLQQAALADRWDVTPVLQLANAYRTLAATDLQRREEWEEKWLAAESEAASRSSRDPVVMRQLGDHRLFHYQQWGERAMLEAAGKWYGRAVELSPSHEAYAAQWAEVLRALGDRRAQEIATRAIRLSNAGGYYERLLDFTLIYEARVLGTNSPKPVMASEVLADFYPESD